MQEGRGEAHYLDRDYKVAKRKLAQLLRKNDRQIAGARDWLTAPFATLCNAFLDDMQDDREPVTYEGYRYRLLRALRILDPELQVGQVTKDHISTVLDLSLA